MANFTKELCEKINNEYFPKFKGKEFSWNNQNEKSVVNFSFVQPANLEETEFKLMFIFSNNRYVLLTDFLNFNRNEIGEAMFSDIYTLIPN